MAMDTKDVHSVLNDLIETCKDGEEGFRTAAEHIKNSSLQTLFTTLSAQRAKFASELQAEVSRIGGSPEKSGSIAGAAHRGWINMKNAITGSNEAAIIEECERGEDVAKDAYQKALQRDLPTDIRRVVERQQNEVVESHDRVRALRNTAGVSSGYGGA